MVPLDILRYIVSIGINVGSFILILFGIAMSYVTLSGHPALHYFIFFLGLTLLGYFEGLQVAILELEHVKFTPELAAMYPRGKSNHDMCHTPKDVARFLVGRQFGVIFVVFILSQVMTLPYLPPDSIPEVLKNIFIDTGLPGAFVALTFAQLPLQLLAQLNPYFVLNLPGANIVLYYTFFINDIGLAHSCYIAAGFFNWIARFNTKPGGIPPSSHTGQMGFTDYVRYIFGTLNILWATAVIFYGIGKGYAVLPGHPIIHFGILAFCLTLLAFLEGLQISILTLEHEQFPDEYKTLYPRAYSIHKKATGGKGVNWVTKFLVGRQFFVIFVFILVSQITAYPTWPRTSLPDGLYTLILDTGLPGAILTTCIGSLLAQLVNQRNPYWAMNIFGSWHVYWITLITEFLGIAHFNYIVIKTMVCLSRADKKPGCHDLTKDNHTEVELNPLSNSNTLSSPTDSEFLSSGSESHNIHVHDKEMIHG